MQKGTVSAKSEVFGAHVFAECVGLIGFFGFTDLNGLIEFNRIYRITALWGLQGLSSL